MQIPDSIMNKTLTSVNVNGRYVAPYSFYGQSSLSSISAKTGILFVDEYSFGNCTSLTDNSLDFNKLKYIGPFAFSGCSGLSGAMYLNNVWYIGKGAFADTNISEILLDSYTCILGSTDAIPSSVTAIKVPPSYVDAYKSSIGWSEFASIIVAR